MRETVIDGDSRFDDVNGPIFEGDDAAEDSATVCDAMKGMGIGVLRERTTRRISGFVSKQLYDQQVTERELFRDSDFEAETGRYFPPELKIDWEEWPYICTCAHGPEFKPWETEQEDSHSQSHEIEQPRPKGQGVSCTKSDQPSVSETKEFKKHTKDSR